MGSSRATMADLLKVASGHSQHHICQDHRGHIPSQASTEQAQWARWDLCPLHLNLPHPTSSLSQDLHRLPHRSKIQTRISMLSNQAHQVCSDNPHTHINQASKLHLPLPHQHSTPTTPPPSPTPKDPPPHLHNSNPTRPSNHPVSHRNTPARPHTANNPPTPWRVRIRCIASITLRARRTRCIVSSIRLRGVVRPRCRGQGVKGGMERLILDGW